MRLPLFASLLLLAGVFFSACENDPNEVAAMFADQRPDAEIISGFRTIYSDSAQIKVRISGPLMLRFLEGGQFIQQFPQGLFVEFFGNDGEITSTLASKYGIRNEALESVLVQDSVVWLATKGDRLDTDELIWEARQEKIYSDKFVRVIQGDKLITGVGFESNQDFTRSKVRAIQGVVNLPKER
jgi:LPS export ABC transporter protein LptC